MYIRYNPATRHILHRSTVPFTINPAAGEADCELADAVAAFEPCNQARLTLALSALEFDPALVPPPAPDWTGFRLSSFAGCLAALDATMTDADKLAEVSRRMDLYPSFVQGIQFQNVSLVQAVMARAHADYLLNTSQGITPAMASAIQAAMVTNHLVSA